MLPIFTKLLDLVTGEDVAELIDQRWPEGGTVEFKKDLSGKRGHPNPWWAGEAMGDRARDEILSEVIAFANSYGGTLMLGIEETTTKPSCAAGCHPLPRCGELADRLTDQIRHCIEPRLPTFEIRGIPIEEDGGGVVMIRVPTSRLRPHRLEKSRNAFHRKADRCEEMTMREIQDLTLFADRRSGEIDRAFEERRDRFGRWIEQGRAHEPVFAARVTALPVSTELYADRVFGHPDLFPAPRSFPARFGREIVLVASHAELAARPILRGARRNHRGDIFEIYQEVLCGGLVEMGLKVIGRDNARPRIYVASILALAANVMMGLHRFRLARGAPDVEYGFEVELKVLGRQLEIEALVDDQHERNAIGLISQNQLLIPRMSLAGTDEFEPTLNLLLRDFYDAAGTVWPGDTRLQVDFGDALG